MTLPYFDAERLAHWARSARREFHASYLAMYSSWFGGIVTDPLLMLVPADDHMVHRGDAVFEAFKCVAGAIYNLDAHLERLAASALAVGIAAPLAPEALRAIVLETARAGRQPDCMIRVYLARGPGSFAANPYDCPQATFYVVVTRRPVPVMDRFPDGVRVTLSAVPVKPAPFGAVKSCNYLPNALMEKEAVERGAQFAVAFDETGRLAEGATENVGIVSADRRLWFPRSDRILRGTTMARVVTLAETLVRDGALREAEYADVTRSQFEAAAEILICGTTPDVTAVVAVDGRPVGDGRPGDVYRRLTRLLLDDIAFNAERRTPLVF